MSCSELKARARAQLGGGIFQNLWMMGLAVCLLIGYPVSYWMSREGKSFQRMAMVLIMLPMWMNFLLRTYSWMTILENNGLLNQLFQKIGLIALYNRVTGADVEFFQMINTQGAVVLGMVYNYLPFMILPIYSVIIKLDPPRSTVRRTCASCGASSCRCRCRGCCRGLRWCSCRRCRRLPSAGCSAAARSCCSAT